jgi:hypothetical protein
MGKNRGQQIVEVVSQTACQRADGLCLARLINGLQGLFLCQVGLVGANPASRRGTNVMQDCQQRLRRSFSSSITDT